MGGLLGFSRKSEGQLLTASDLTYEGSFKMPSFSSPFWSARSAVPITWRNGRLLTTGNVNTADSNKVYEVDLPVLTPTGTNTASVTTYWGDIGERYTPGSSNAVRTNGLYYDPVSSRLWRSYMEFYGAATTHASVGWCTLDDDTDTITDGGTWALDGIDARRRSGGVLRMPDEFVAANCSGRPMLIGFGSIFFSTAGGGSYGPSFYAAPDPDTGTYANHSDLPNTRIIAHNSQAGTINWYTDPQRAIRGPDSNGDSDDYEIMTWGYITPVSLSRVDLGSQGWDDGRYDGMEMNIYDGTGSPSNGHTLTWVSGTIYDVSPNVPALDTTSRWEIPEAAAATDDWPPTGGDGYWIVNDLAQQSTVWISGSKHGVLVLCSHITGKTSYQHAIFSEGFRHCMYAYHRDDLASAIAAEIDFDKVSPRATWDFQNPAITYPIGGTNGVDQFNIRSKWLNMAYEESTRRIAMIWTGGWTDGSDNYPMVSIYQVAGSN
jgi:hypothetical protein